jgi:hypothetical protein
LDRLHGSKVAVLVVRDIKVVLGLGEIAVDTVGLGGTLRLDPVIAVFAVFEQSLDLPTILDWI